MKKYLDLVQKINKEELEEYYKEHTTKDVIKNFNIDSGYLLNKILAYWNIKRHTPKENSDLLEKNMSEEKREERAKILSKGRNGRKLSKETIEKIRQSNLGIKKKATRTSFQKGNIPWNKGKKGVEKWLPDTNEKRYNTMKENKSFNTSKPEENLYKELCKEYGEENVIRQYYDAERYPYSCDFYIKTKDLFIELNLSWTHGGKPYNAEDKECQEQLKLWEEKAKTSEFYRNAIYTWTVRDVNKRNCAKQNNINYKEIF